MEAWNRLPDLVTITAVCDVDKRKAEEFSAKYGVPAVYQDLSEMLDREKPDFLDIVTRPEQHLGDGSRGGISRHSYPVPEAVCANHREAEQIISLFNNSRPRLMVNENFRFQAWYREIRNCSIPVRSASRSAFAGSIGPMTAGPSGRTPTSLTSRTIRGC
jgi:hypothetical protein